MRKSIALGRKPLTEASIEQIDPPDVRTPDLRGSMMQRRQLNMFRQETEKLADATGIDATFVPVFVKDLEDILRGQVLPQNVQLVCAFRVDDGADGTRLPGTVAALTQKNSYVVIPDKAWFAAHRDQSQGHTGLGAFGSLSAALNYFRLVTKAADDAPAQQDGASRA